MTEALRRAFAEAAAGGRVGALKEVMTAQYTRLAQLTEDLIARLVQDTEVRFCPVWQSTSSRKGTALRVHLPMDALWNRDLMHVQHFGLASHHSCEASGQSVELVETFSVCCGISARVVPYCSMPC